MPNPIKTKLTVLIVGLACLGLGALFASTLGGRQRTPGGLERHKGAPDTDFSEG
jgi:hypothetical protein